MAAIKLSTFMFSSDATVTVSLLNTAFNAVGDKWVKPTVVDFPVYFDGGFAVAPAIVAFDGVQAVKDCIALIEGTDENDADGILKCRRAIARLPKRIFIRQLYRESIVDLIMENSEISTTTHKVGGAFADKLLSLCPAGEVTATELQTAVTKAAKVGNSNKTIVAHADGFARNARGRKYQLLKYDLELRLYFSHTFPQPSTSVGGMFLATRGKIVKC